MKVPFLDLSRQHAPLKAELSDAFNRTVDKSAFVGGESVNAFEKEFAGYCDVSSAAAVNSGTDALRFALIALGVKPGDKVVTVPHTFVATTEAISQCGGEIMFVDVERETGLMDVGHLKSLLAKTPVRAVIPVHLYGQCVDMDPIFELKKTYGFKILEDASQAHGATYKGRRAGNLGDAAAFSFYPGKNLGALGEGGAVVSSDAAVIATCKMLRDHGQSEKYVHAIEGYNGRLDAVQTECLRIKLKHLDVWNAQRREQAHVYAQGLRPLEGLRLLQMREYGESVFHLYVIHVAKPKELFKFLQTRDIGAGFHYPIPLHLQTCYERLGHKTGDFPVTEELASTLISLPIFPGLRPDEQEHVVQAVRDFMGEM